MRQSDAMKPFPIRVSEQGWEVLTKRNRWTKCTSHRQAHLLAHSTQLVNDAATSRRSGIAFSAELEATAVVLDQIGAPGAKLCRYYAANNTNSLATELARQGKPR
jgi:hypothetical protein